MTTVEPVSDSDSASTSSWIFVDDNVDTDVQQEKKKYYLNCLSEPIETDSDSISVISETEDNFKNEDNYTNDNGNDEGHAKDNAEEIESDNEEYKEVIQRLGDGRRTTIKVIQHENHSGSDVKFFIILLLCMVTSVILGALFNKTERLAVNTYKSHYENDIHDSSEDVHMEDLMDLPHDFNEDNDDGFKEYQHVQRDLEISGRDKASQHANRMMETEEKDNLNNVGIERKTLKRERKDKNKELIKNGMQYMKEQMEVKQKNDKYNKNREKMRKGVQFKKGTKEMKGKPEKKKNKNDKKNNRKNEYLNEERYGNINKLKKIINNQAMKIDELKRLLRSKDKLLRMMEENIYREIKELRNIHFREKIQRFNKTISGEWYDNYFHQRDKIRKQEREASWVFERADFRKKMRIR